MKSSRSLFLAIAYLALSLPAARADLVAYYALDNDTVNGTTVSDLSGTGYDLTNKGTTSGQPGQFGQSFFFPGTSVGADANLSRLGGLPELGSSFTISLWLNTADLEQTQKYLFHNRGPAIGGEDQQNAVVFGYLARTVELFSTSNAVTGSDPRSLSQIILTDANTWNNVVYTYDGIDFRGYLNGDKVFDHVTSFSLTASGQASFIGGVFGRAEYSGFIDEVSIWNNALSGSQIRALQTTSLRAVPEPSALALLGVGALGLLMMRRMRRPALSIEEPAR